MCRFLKLSVLAPWREKSESGKKTVSRKACPETISLRSDLSPAKRAKLTRESVSAQDPLAPELIVLANLVHVFRGIDDDKIETLT